MINGSLKWLLTFFIVFGSFARAGEVGGGTDNGQAVEEADGSIDDAEKEGNREVGLRMDPLLFVAAAQFIKGEDVGDIVPAGAVSSAEHGYVVQEYKILDPDGGEYGSFYRIRTLVVDPIKDVTVIFDKDGKIADSYDLRPPKLDEKATRELERKATKKKVESKVEADGDAKKDGEANAEAELDMSNARFNGVPTGIILSLMAGMDPAKEAGGINAIMNGLVKAAELSTAGGMSSINPAPADPKAFQVTLPLPKVGTPAPTFNFKTVDGKAVGSAAMAGKPYIVTIFSLKVMVGLTSKEPLERRGAVMISRIGRWLEANSNNKDAMSRLVMVMTDPKENVIDPKDGKSEVGGTLVCEPKAAKTFGADVLPAILFYGADGKLEKAFSATSDISEIVKELNRFFNVK